jgi:hypothetical protein
VFELSEFEEEICDKIVEGALDTAVRLIFNKRPCNVEDIDNEVRIRMIGALENGSPYGPLH